jgi:lactate dehydrogenase-like 2-hydroxyacid dehydrogenase
VRCTIRLPAPSPRSTDVTEPPLVVLTPVLLVTFQVLPTVRALIASRRQARFNETGRRLTAEELLQGAIGCDVLVVTATDRLTADTIAALPDSVRTIATYSVGFEHIDLEAAKARGLAVLHTPDVLTDAVAETALFLTLGAARRGNESLQLIHSRQWQGWTPVQLPGVQLAGKRFGVFGMGRIGQAIAQRAAAFGMEIHYHNRRPLPEDEARGARYHAQLETFLPLCQFLMLSCPLTPETHHFLNATRIGQLPRGAIVVNIARGNVIEDEALIAALRSGKLQAAGLDVFANEPHLDPRYFELPSAFILPHIGSSTIEAREGMATLLLDGLDRLERGQPLTNRLV